MNSYNDTSSSNNYMREGEKTMAHGVDTYDVGTLAGLRAVGYGGYGYDRNAIFNSYQNNRNLGAIKDGTGEVKDSIQRKTILDSISEGNQTADIKGAINTQSAFFEGRLNTIARELCDIKVGQKDSLLEMYKLDKSNKDLELNRLNTIATLKEGCVAPTCNTCSQSPAVTNNIDINAIRSIVALEIQNALKG